MSNAIASTMFARRMALREALLNQSRQDKMIEDDRKLKALSEVNRSTDLALQAQGKAMERKRRDAMELEKERAFLGLGPTQYDEDESVQDAADVGYGAGGVAQAGFVQKGQLARLKETEAMRRARLAEGGRDQRATKSREQALDLWAMTHHGDAEKEAREQEKLGIQRKKLGLAQEMQPVEMRRKVAQTGMFERSPAQFAMQSATEDDKTYRDTVNVLHSKRATLQAQLAKLSTGLEKMINTEEINRLKAEIDSNLAEEEQALSARLRLGKGDPELKKQLQSIFEARVAIHQGKLPAVPVPQPTVGGGETSSMDESAPDEVDQIMSQMK